MEETLAEVGEGRGRSYLPFYSRPWIAANQLNLTKASTHPATKNAGVSVSLRSTASRLSPSLRTPTLLLERASERASDRRRERFGKKIQGQRW